MVDCQQDKGLHELGLDDRALYGDDWFMREDWCSFRYRPYVTGEFEVPEILQKFLREGILAAEIVDIFVGELQILHISNQLFHTCHDGKSAVVRNPSEKHVEYRFVIPDVRLKVAVCHGDFVEVGEHGQIVII